MRSMGLTPGYTPAQQAMADAFHAQYGGGGGGAVFVQPAVVAAPACAFGPAATADSAECQAQVIANNLQTIANRSASNYDVDLQNCLNTFPQPPDCYQRTFGLTLPGTTGGTSADIPNAANLLGDPAAQALAAEGAQNNAPTAPPAPHPPAPTPPAPTAPATTPATTPAQKISDTLTGGSTVSPTPTSCPQGYDSVPVDAAASGWICKPTSDTTSSSKALYWIGGIAALALLFAAVK
jgi:hypothetical protein